MFGLVPRALWSKLISPDPQGRIELAHNCLLLERIGAEDKNPFRVLIESGSGDKFDAKNRAIFGLSDASIITAIEQTGLRCEQIDQVILTHLHFDHAGGVTRRPQDQEGPGPRLTFPNAPILVQRREWEDAIINRSVMTRTYLAENLEPIRDRVKLIEAPPPFPEGQLPGKEQSPPDALEARMVEVLPGIRVFRVPGHTWGQQAVAFNDDRGRTVVFTPDLIPTLHHVGAAYNMAYDVEPYISTVTRRWFLEEAAKNDWLLVLDHEPGNPCCRAREDGKGWYVLKQEG